MKTLNETKTKELTVSQIASELYHSEETISDWSQAMKLAWAMKKVESDMKLEDFFRINKNEYFVDEEDYREDLQDNNEEKAFAKFIQMLYKVIEEQSYYPKSRTDLRIDINTNDVIFNPNFFNIEKIELEKTVHFMNKLSYRQNKIYSYKTGEKAIFINKEKYVLNSFEESIINALNYKLY
jgi:hypothetical protein